MAKTSGTPPGTISGNLLASSRAPGGGFPIDSNPFKGMGGVALAQLARAVFTAIGAPFNHYTSLLDNSGRIASFTILSAVGVNDFLINIIPKTLGLEWRSNIQGFFVQTGIKTGFYQGTRLTLDSLGTAARATWDAITEFVTESNPENGGLPIHPFFTSKTVKNPERIEANMRQNPFVHQDEWATRALNSEASNSFASTVLPLFALAATLGIAAYAYNYFTQKRDESKKLQAADDSSSKTE